MHDQKILTIEMQIKMKIKRAGYIQPLLYSLYFYLYSLVIADISYPSSFHLFRISSFE